jgi:uncharacterized membrane-anchored protein
MAQLFVPAQMIYQQEETIGTGKPYKFKTQPIDPTDPFRGKFITLNYEIESFQTTEDWPYGEDIFIYLKTDKDGFAAVKTVSKTLIAIDEDYVMAKSYSAYNGNLNFEFPFDRFYMNENKAYDAEVSVRNAQRDSTSICYALVFVKDGTAVLNNIFIDDTPIQQFVEEYQQSVE